MRFTFPGEPMTKLPAGIAVRSVISVPAATMLPAPIVTPFKMTAPMPIRQRDSMVQPDVGLASQSCPFSLSQHPLGKVQAALSHCRGAIYCAPTKELADTESRQDIIRVVRLTRKPPLHPRTNESLDAAPQLGHHRSVETRCAQCGAAMTCQQEAGCWCAELPHVPMPDGSKGCLCRDCLLAEIEALKNSGDRKEA